MVFSFCFLIDDSDGDLLTRRMGEKRERRSDYTIYKVISAIVNGSNPRNIDYTHISLDKKIHLVSWNSDSNNAIRGSEHNPTAILLSLAAMKGRLMSDKPRRILSDAITADQDHVAKTLMKQVDKKTYKDDRMLWQGAQVDLFWKGYEKREYH